MGAVRCAPCSGSTTDRAFDRYPQPARSCILPSMSLLACPPSPPQVASSVSFYIANGWLFVSHGVFWGPSGSARSPASPVCLKVDKIVHIEAGDQHWATWSFLRVEGLERIVCLAVPPEDLRRTLGIMPPNAETSAESCEHCGYWQSAADAANKERTAAQARNVHLEQAAENREEYIKQLEERLRLAVVEASEQRSAAEAAQEKLRQLLAEQARSGVSLAVEGASGQLSVALTEVGQLALATPPSEQEVQPSVSRLQAWLADENSPLLPACILMPLLVTVALALGHLLTS